jgi:hypothetical protein
METSFTLVTLAASFGTAWLFWKAIQPAWRNIEQAPGKGSHRQRYMLIWATVGVFLVSLFIWPFILRWMG